MAARCYMATNGGYAGSIRGSKVDQEHDMKVWKPLSLSRPIHLAKPSRISFCSARLEMPGQISNLSNPFKSYLPHLHLSRYVTMSKFERHAWDVWSLRMDIGVILVQQRLAALARIKTRMRLEHFGNMWGFHVFPMIFKSFSTKALQVLRPSNCRVQASCVHLALGPPKAGELAGGSVHASNGKSTGAGTGLGVLKRMLFHSVSTYSTEFMWCSFGL